MKRTFFGVFPKTGTALALMITHLLKPEQQQPGNIRIVNALTEIRFGFWHHFAARLKQITTHEQKRYEKQDVD